MKQYKDPKYWKARRDFCKQLGNILISVVLQEMPKMEEFVKLFDMVCEGECKNEKE